MSSKQALVFGASGVSGWAITRECLIYPSPSTFERVVAITKRPLEKSEFMVPDDQLTRLELASDVDLTAGIEAVTARLRQIPGIESITHVFFTAYGGHGQSWEVVKELNVSMLRNAATSVRTLCPSVDSWTLQTGGKAYGVEFLMQPGFKYGPVPLVESLAPIPDPWAEKIFYYAQVNALEELASGARDKKPWRVVELRPDIIVGFTPHGNAMGFGFGLGLFLALYRHVHGDGATVPFPGNEIVWNSKRSESTQDVLARFHIHTALHGDSKAVDGRAFNIADEDCVTWSGGLWKDVCGYFGLVGAAPGETEDDSSPKGVEWVMANRDSWVDFVQKNSLRSGFLETATWQTVAVVFGYSLFDRHYDLSASRSTEFKDYAPTSKGYLTTFDRMKKARIIP